MKGFHNWKLLSLQTLLHNQAKNCWNNHNLQLRRGKKEGWRYFSLLTVAKGLRKAAERGGWSCRGVKDPPVSSQDCGAAGDTVLLSPARPHRARTSSMKTPKHGSSQAGSAAATCDAVPSPLPQPVAAGLGLASFLAQLSSHDPAYREQCCFISQLQKSTDVQNRVLRFWSQFL